MKIHDLVILGRKVNLPDELLQKCEKLSLAYTESRYGISMQKFPAGNFTKEKVRQFLLTAMEVLEWAKKI